MAEARQILDEAMTEEALMQAVIQLAEHRGWLWMHIPDRLYKLAAKQRRYDALVGAKAFPDLLMLRCGRQVIIETKTETGRLDDDQRRWLSAFEACQATEVYVFRPSDWPKIERVLA